MKRTPTSFVIVWTFVLLVNIAVWAIVATVAWHFISKFW
jgi:hypothetical protein